MEELGYEEPRYIINKVANNFFETAGERAALLEELYRNLAEALTPVQALKAAQLEYRLDLVLDMLAGRYPSDEFAELRPRIVWDRVAGVVRGRAGTQRLEAELVLETHVHADHLTAAPYLRERTGAGMMECKKALVAAEGDEEMTFAAAADDTYRTRDSCGAGGQREPERPERWLASIAPLTRNIAAA